MFQEPSFGLPLIFGAQQTHFSVFCTAVATLENTVPVWAFGTGGKPKS